MNPAPAISLSTAELDSSLSYLELGGASYVFPQPFEIAAIRHSWDRVRPVLERINLLSYNPRDCFKMTAPKQRALIRPVHLLDPIDAILYTGLVIRLAAELQNERDKYQNDCVFSYRFDASELGNSNMLVSDWDARKDRLRELCRQYHYIGVTDIVDFFPRIYLHRIDNAVAALSKDELATRALMRFLESWSSGTSYGIPTGPRVSNFLAEALLVEVDQYLISCEIEFVRWVDDYWLFADSEDQMVASFYRLGERLNDTQGLSLNSSKTQIRTTDEYIQHVLDREDPEEWRSEILEILFADNDPYSAIDFENLTEDEIKAINAVDAEAVLERALEGDLVDLDSVKFILTFLSALRRPDLVDPVLNNLSRLVPVSSSVAHFFDALDEVAEAEHPDIGRRIIDYINRGGFVPDFQAMWLLDPFTKSENWNSLEDIRKLARNARNRFVRRQAYLALRMSGDRSSLLDAKAALEDSSDWERRGILYACSRLPNDERDAIIAQAGGHGGEWRSEDVLLKSVLVYMKAHT